MKPIAIVYTSNTGFTAQYASLLGGETGLPVHSLKDAMKTLPQGSPILYLGWLAAGKVQSYDKAVTNFDIQALCAVGMGECGSQIEDVKKANRLPEGLPLFTLQGGFDLKKLRGVYKPMMLVMSRTVVRKLAAKPDRTPGESDMLDLFQNGGNRVSLNNLRPVLAWFEEERL
ncbi:MAG: hypothetical protein Q4F81_00385 [Eubacteriales bacterium]|nr:hypothetical protein [Eubacteriales bacterium]